MINGVDLYIVVQQGRLLCHASKNTLHSSHQLSLLGIQPQLVAHQVQPLGLSSSQQTHLLPLFVPDERLETLVSDPNEPWHWVDLRELLASHDEPQFQLHARAVQYFYWLREHQFCGICGGRTHMSNSENALECSACHKYWFPRIQPCIITLIHNKDHILLAKHRRYTTNTYSCIAGFAESGENLEQTLIREVYEEVGLQVHNLSYFGSQAWPFPYQLMVGFYAEYLSGDIRVDQDEIVDAKWWPIDNLPDHPPTLSISGQLIEHYVANPRY